MPCVCSGGQIAVSLRPGPEGVLVDVSDTVPGIPEALQPVLFTRPAFSSSSSRNGGLGLMIVKRILQLHDCDIQLLKLPARGAVFRFELKGQEALYS